MTSPVSGVRFITWNPNDDRTGPETSSTPSRTSAGGELGYVLSGWPAAKTPTGRYGPRINGQFRSQGFEGLPISQPVDDRFGCLDIGKKNVAGACGAVEGGHRVQPGLDCVLVQADAVGNQNGSELVDRGPHDRALILIRGAAERWKLDADFGKGLADNSQLNQVGERRGGFGVVEANRVDGKPGKRSRSVDDRLELLDGDLLAVDRGQDIAIIDGTSPRNHR